MFLKSSPKTSAASALAHQWPHWPHERQLNYDGCRSEGSSSRSESLTDMACPWPQGDTRPASLAEQATPVPSECLDKPIVRPGPLISGCDRHGRRQRIKRKGRTKEIVKDKLIKAVDDLEAGIETSDSYTVAEALTDWLDRSTREFDASTVTTYRMLAEKNLIPLIGATKLKKTERRRRRQLARKPHRQPVHGQPEEAPFGAEARHPASRGPRQGGPERGHLGHDPERQEGAAQ